MRVHSFWTPLLTFIPVLAFLGLAAESPAATFGSVVPVRGTVSDIALDESRAAIYAANFTAYRVEIIDIPSRSIRSSISVNRPPSAVAVSPNKRYLVIGEYEVPNTDPTATQPFDGKGGITIRDLTNGFSRHLDLESPVLTIAFGSDAQSLVVTRSSVLRVDPVSAVVTLVDVPPLLSVNLPSDLAKFPTQIIQATSGVSGDGLKIFVMAATEKDPAAASNKTAFLTYDVATHTLSGFFLETTPPEGPRAISSDQTGANLVFGWGLLRIINANPHLWAQFPAADGAFNLGTHAWDTSRNLIYAQIPAPRDKSVLHILDTENLTVRERISLQENLSGKSLMSGDMNTMYSISVSGLTFLPIGQLPSTPQLRAAQEDILFAADACNRLVLTQTIDLLSVGTSAADFTLSLPKGTTGVTLSKTSGVTPAQVQITIDPSAFQGAKGTTAIPLTLTTSSGVNLPAAVRILVNTRDFDQRGTVFNIPGKLVDMLADPARGRLYLLRQDTNQVQVWDSARLRQIGAMKTGNTPTQMALTADNRFLIVGNDNSQIANVLDLDTLTPSDPILFPFGHYPRSIGAASTEMFGLVRNAGVQLNCAGTDTGTSTPVALLDQIDFANRVATPTCTLGGRVPSIYTNNLSTADGVITPSPDHTFLLLSLADGNVAEYDSIAGTWTASRSDFSGLSGPYAAFNDGQPLNPVDPRRRLSFQVGPNLLDSALVPMDQSFGVDSGAGSTTSGAASFGGWGVLSSANAANAPGIIQRWNTQDLGVVSTTPMAEAPVTRANMIYQPIGQIGESVSSFTRSLAVSADQQTLFAATISGLTVFTADFDARPQPPVITSVANPADFTQNIATGGAITINGAGLAGGTVSSVGYPLPETLGEACATVNNIALPLFRVSPSQIVAQLPFTVTGGASLVVRALGGISSPFPITVNASAPAIFHTASTADASGLPAVYRDDNGGVVDFGNPIHPNTELTIYLTGLGITAPLPTLGAATPSSPPYNVVLTPTVTLGTQNMAVTSATLVPGLATVYQLKVRAPGVVQPGKSIPLTIQGGGISTSLSVRVVTP